MYGAKRLARASLEALTAFRHVSMLEQLIARLISPGETEGDTSCIGAVTAALGSRAQKHVRQTRLAHRIH